MILFKGKTFVKNPLLKIYLISQNLFFFPFTRKKVNKVNKVEKILVCNLAHLGDVVLVTSLIPSLIKKYPNAKISFLVSSDAKVVVEALPYVYKIHLFDHLKLNRSRNNFGKKTKDFITTFISAFTEIKKEQYDLSIDPYLFYPNSNFLTYLAKVPKRIGYACGGGGVFLTDSYQIDQLHHVTYFNNFLVKSLGAEVNENKTFYKPYLNFLDDLNIKPPISYWIFHPFSGDEKKNIPISFWMDLLEFFSAKKQYVIFTGKSENESLDIKNIIGKNPLAINLASKTTFKKFNFYIKHANGMVSIDTASVHVACCYSKPIISIFRNYENKILWNTVSKKSFFVYF